jgi:hypothetical protein
MNQEKPRMRIYVCCPESGCTSQRNAMNFFRSFGLEPTPGFDEEKGHHYLEVQPDSLSRKKRKRFFAEIAKMITYR